MMTLRPREEEVLRQTVTAIDEWLAPEGLYIDVRLEDDEDEPARMGLYETGTVFEKTIKVTVSPQAIRDYVQHDATADEMRGDLRLAGWARHGALKTDYSAFQLALTIYHELGHALLEQIIDWMENIPEFDEIIGEDLIKRYNAVLEDSLPEEDLVEDFAWSIICGRTHDLKECFQELSTALL